MVHQEKGKTSLGISVVDKMVEHLSPVKMDGAPNVSVPPLSNINRGLMQYTGDFCGYFG